MIKEDIKNLIIRNKIEKNPSLFASIMKADPEITVKEAYEIMYKVDPKKTEVIVVNSKEDFAKLMKIKTFESWYTSNAYDACVNPNYFNVPIKDSLETMHFIRGYDHIKVGEICVKMEGNIVEREPVIDDDGEFIVIKETIKTKGLVNKKVYEVIVYIP